MLLIGVPVSHTMLRTAVAGLRGGSVRMSAAATQTRSALLEQTGLPKFDEIETPSVKPAVQDVLANLETDFASLESKFDTMEAPTYADVMEELEKVEAPIEYAWGVVGHLMGVKNSDELREVCLTWLEPQPSRLKIHLPLTRASLALGRRTPRCSRQWSRRRRSSPRARPSTPRSRRSRRAATARSTRRSSASSPPRCGLALAIALALTLALT